MWFFAGEWVVNLWPCVVHQSDCEDVSSLFLCVHNSSAKAIETKGAEETVDLKYW